MIKGQQELLEKINAAVKAANEAQGELVSRSKALGPLLLEVKKRHHPKVKDFDAFLKSGKKIFESERVPQASAAGILSGI